MGDMHKLTRRGFVVSTAAIGGGMTIGLTWAAPEAPRDMTQPWAKPSTNAEFTPWISIAPDSTVTVRVATPEIGNGVMTQAAMTVAEELNCDWKTVRAEFASTERNLAEKGVYTTAGGGLAYFSGRSTHIDRIKLGLQVGASARERLKAAAAAEWKVPVADIEAKDSVLTHKPTGRTLKYGQVAAKAAAVKLAAEPAPKPQSEWTFLGKASPGKLNLPAIVNGSAVYGMDVRLPNMAYAAILQSPVHGGRLKRYDDSVAKKMPGVIAVVVIDPSEPRGLPANLKFPFPLDNSNAQSGIAVVAEHYWQARKALDAVVTEWDDGPGARWRSTAYMYDTAIKALDGAGAKVEKTAGDVTQLDRQEKVLEATYHMPYSDHATMEPLNSTVLVTRDGVEVWHPGQHSEQGFWVAAHEAGVVPEKVQYHQTYVGGGFGRRVFGSELRMAVAVAKKVPGRPVHVIWSREETTRQGRYRHMVAAKLRAGVAKGGKLEALTARYATSGGFYNRGLVDTAYALGQVKNLKFESFELPLHLLTGPYRAPGYNSFAFIMETFIDECAHAASVDPLDFRLKLLEGYPDPGWAMCLKEAANKAGWGKSLPKGTAQGLAISNWGNSNTPSSGTTVAVVATVEVTKKGLLNVQQLDVAFDTGRILNRDAVLTEMEGGTIWGLNMALHEELNLRDGRVVEGNYDTYQMLRMGDVSAKINVHFGGLSGHDRFSEVGEPPVGPVGPAIGNAIFRATGKRIRSTPILKHDLSWA